MGTAQQPGLGCKAVTTPGLDTRGGNGSWSLEIEGSKQRAPQQERGPGKEGAWD